MLSTRNDVSVSLPEQWERICPPDLHVRIERVSTQHLPWWLPVVDAQHPVCLVSWKTLCRSSEFQSLFKAREAQALNRCISGFPGIPNSVFGENHELKDRGVEGCVEELLEPVKPGSPHPPLYAPFAVRHKGQALPHLPHRGGLAASLPRAPASLTHACMPRCCCCCC